jgi:hypothetical protein
VRFESQLGGRRRLLVLAICSLSLLIAGWLVLILGVRT